MMRSLLLLALVACADRAALDETAVPVGIEDRTIDGDGLVLTAFPSLSIAADGSTRALPLVVSDVDFDAMPDLELPRPFALEGTVVGRTTVPAPRTTLPGIEAPIAATVDFLSERTAASIRVSSSVQDGFATSIVGGEHTVTILPDDPNLGLSVFAATLDADVGSVELELLPSLPVWGQVLAVDGPRPGASVRLRTATGLLGSVAQTDADGWYVLFAGEGSTIEVVTSGDGDGVEPEIVSDPVLVTRQGARVDLTYQDVLPVFLSLRVVGPNGAGQRTLPYRLQSLDIDGYGDEARVVQRGFLDNAGNLVTRALPGRYRLDLLVDDATELSGSSLEVVLDGPTSLGTLALEPFTALEGRVADAELPIADAQVTCGEIDLAQRTWTTTTDVDGAYQLDVPAGPLTCVVLPPDERPDVASERFRLDADERSADVTLRAGRTLAGRVLLDGEPEALAVVEVRTDDGTLIGTDLTGSDGSYRIRVQP